MSASEKLYDLVFPTPTLTDVGGRGPILVHGLEGFSDAGRAVRQATDHIRENNSSELIAKFNPDELVDYRSRRPAMTYSYDHFVGYDEPQLSLHAITTPDDTTFLLLSGFEPDMKWEAFASAVTHLSADFGVKLAIGLGAMPLNVPHTRPIRSSAHSKDIELLEGFSTWPGEFKIPGSADALLEVKLSEQGFATMGFTAHVPHYLSQSEYPAAAIRLVEDINRISGLNIAVGELETEQKKFDAALQVQVSGNAEIGQMVEGLEKNYDEIISARESQNSLAPAEGPLPTGDELGAELEQFLMRQGDEEKNDEGPFGGPELGR